MLTTKHKQKDKDWARNKTQKVKFLTYQSQELDEILASNNYINVYVSLCTYLLSDQSVQYSAFQESVKTN